jgi:exo-1,4-beta-D-glucosaminidase
MSIRTAFVALLALAGAGCASTAKGGFDAGIELPDGGAEGDGGSGGDDLAVGCVTSCADVTTPLRAGWRMQASGSVGDAGAAIATVGYPAGGWYPITVPATVMAGLVQNGQFGDLYVSDNMVRVDTAPFAGAWWYRTEFSVPADYAGQRVWLHLDGINYKATLWVNGHQVAGPDALIGTFRHFEFDITEWVDTGGPNALALSVSPPDLANDLTLTWVDWNPAPPDRGLGVWRDVYLTKSGAVTVRAPLVSSKLDLPSLDRAHVTVRASVANAGSAAVAATVTGIIDDSITFSRDVTLAAGASAEVTFDDSQFAQLRIDHPKLWWPRDLGAPNRHRLVVRATVDGQVSDERVVRFGLRQVDSTVAAGGGRLFKINGKPIAIRGGAWTPDMLLRIDSTTLAQHVRYVDDLGLNAVRLEGKLVSEELYDLFDERGILVILGWNCCDRWQAWGAWKEADRVIANASLRDQALRLGNHPSIIDFLIGSDLAPPPSVESAMVATLNAAHWPAVVSSAASDQTTAALGKSGFKMAGPYDWVPPSYWELDDGHGGAFGFSSEISPGPAIPTLESLKKMLTPSELDSLWQQPTIKQYHAGLRQFETLTLFNQALSARMGAPTSLADWVQKAQVMNYEAERAMFEAYGRNKYAKSTGVIQWMLNNAWPSLIWHLFDYYLAPGGAYFGAKKGNERLHVAYSYDDQSVVVLHHGAQPITGLTATATVHNLDGSVKYTKTVTLDVGADTVKTAFTLPALPGLSSAYFVVLALSDQSGVPVSDNVYWLSTRAETMDFAASDWYYTPTTQFADLTALAQLAPATMNARATATANGVTVTLKNTSAGMAFFVRAKLMRAAGGAEVLPVLWSDNYVTLPPGGERTISATGDLGGGAAAVEISGWNVATQTLVP